MEPCLLPPLELIHALRDCFLVFCHFCEIHNFLTKSTSFENSSMSHVSVRNRMSGLQGKNAFAKASLRGRSMKICEYLNYVSVRIDTSCFVSEVFVNQLEYGALSEYSSQF